MSNLLPTAILASIVVIVALLGMAIGWLLTGKSKMRRGCGQDPTRSKDEECGKKQQCDLCDHNDKR